MPASVQSGVVIGVDGHPVTVEVDVARRLPRTTIVGLPASAVRESAERVRSAIQASGMEYPRYRVTVNLAPADLRKDGTGLDLPIAVGILAASEAVATEAVQGLFLAGEVALSGSLRAIRGALPLAMLARALGMQRILLPVASASEAAVVPGIEVLEAASLAEVVACLRGEREFRLATPRAVSAPRPTLDLRDVRGQARARRALEVAAAGGHNLLLVGPPGCGKTMLASRLPTILPPLTFEEALDVTRIHSAAGLARGGLVDRRPFRAPHHSISAAGLVGGARLLPGEVSLAHHGVLFLDEVSEFRRDVLELLRGPLEDREVVLTRAAGTARLPAAFSLVAASNPCPCGFLGHPVRPCTCTEHAVERYRARLSGPVRDRIDIQVEMAPVPVDDLLAGGTAEDSATVCERVCRARRVQQRRYRGSRVPNNAALDAGGVRQAARATGAARRLLADAVDRLALSGRTHDRILKVARTLADLEGQDRVDVPHVAEAISLRVVEA